MGKRRSAVHLTPKFVESANDMCRSRKQLRTRIDRTLTFMLRYPELPGLRREPLRSRFSGIHSNRVSQGVRLIDREANGELTALNIGDHGPIYAWIDRLTARMLEGQGSEWRVGDTFWSDSDPMDKVNGHDHPADGQHCDPRPAPDSPDCVSLGLGAEEHLEPVTLTLDDLPVVARGEPSYALIPLHTLLELGLPRDVASRIRHAPDSTLLTKYGLPEQIADEIYELYCDQLYAEELAQQSAHSTVGTSGEQIVPIPRLTAADAILITGPGQFTRMVELGLDRYLTVLTEEQRALAELDARSLTVIKGCAGSGKTTVAVHRVRFLADRILGHPQLLGGASRRVLYLCYNNVLAQVVEQMLTTLYGDSYPSLISVSTLHAWAKQYLVDWGILAATPTRATDERFRKLVDSKDTLGRIANLLTQRRKVVRGQRVDSLWERVDASFIADEIGMVIQGRGLATQQEYLAADRTGRREALTGRERELLWQLYEEYQAKLHGQRILDFASLPQVVLAALRNDPAFTPFEAVVVDEVQDFTPLQLRLATALAGGSARLTVLGDAAQMVYRTGFSWKLAELAPRGAQVKTLTNNFRNTAEIQRAAASLLWASPASADEDSGAPNDVIPRSGPVPTLLALGDRALEHREICRRIQDQIAAGIPPQNIAILAGTKQTLGELAEALKSAGVPVEPFRPRTRVSVRIADRTVKLLTMHSAKGLDFPHVYLVDLTGTGIPTGRSVKGGEVDEETLELQRRLIYTSMCRAGRTLTMSTVRGQEHPLLEALGDGVCHHVMVSAPMPVDDACA